MKLRLAFDLEDRFVRYFQHEETGEEYEMVYESGIMKYKILQPSSDQTPWHIWIEGNPTYI